MNVDEVAYKKGHHITVIPPREGHALALTDDRGTEKSGGLPANAYRPAT